MGGGPPEVSPRPFLPPSFRRPCSDRLSRSNEHRTPLGRGFLLRLTAFRPVTRTAAARCACSIAHRPRSGSRSIDRRTVRGRSVHTPPPLEVVLTSFTSFFCFGVGEHPRIYEARTLGQYKSAVHGVRPRILICSTRFPRVFAVCNLPHAPPW